MVDASRCFPGLAASPRARACLHAKGQHHPARVHALSACVCLQTGLPTMGRRIFVGSLPQLSPLPPSSVVAEGGHGHCCTVFSGCGARVLSCRSDDLQGLRARLQMSQLCSGVV